MTVHATGQKRCVPFTDVQIQMMTRVVVGVVPGADADVGLEVRDIMYIQYVTYSMYMYKYKCAIINTYLQNIRTWK